MFVSAGDHHGLHPSLDGDRSFDLIVAFYGDNPAVRARLVRIADLVIDRKGAKFANLWNLWREQPRLTDEYDAVLVLDDDLGLTATEIDRLFELREEHDLWVLQPSLQPEGRWSFRSLVTRSRSQLRFTNFVEVGAPLFRSDKLREFLEVYDGSLAGWGVDHWYMNVFGENEPKRYAVVDAVSVYNPHSRPGVAEREIDRFQSGSERRDAWLRCREDRQLRQIVPYISGRIDNSLPIFVSAAAGMVTRRASRALRSPDAARREYRSARRAVGLRRRELRLVLLLRRVARACRHGGLSRDLVVKACKAWGNEGFAASPELILSCARELGELRSPGCAVEFGAGISTPLLALAARRVGLSFVSFEHDMEWAEIVARRLRRSGIEADVIHSPLAHREGGDWYECQIPVPCRFVLCDGPPGSTRGGRAGILGALDGALADVAVVVLDDTDREAEGALAGAVLAKCGGDRIDVAFGEKGRRFAIIRVRCQRAEG